MTAYQAAALWTGLLILLLVVLGVRVMMARRRLRISLGDGREGELTVLSRSFGNAAEYVPAGIGALILLAALGAAPWQVHAIGGTLFVGRLVHPFGLALKPPNAARVAGMVLTWTALIAGALLLVVAAFA